MGHDFKEVVLQKIQFRRRIQIPAAIMDSVQFSVSSVDAGESMMVEMCAEILADPEQVISVQWPANWWQHFKQRWFPKWALKRWPVKMASKQLCARAIYPNLVSEKQEHQHRILMFTR